MSALPQKADMDRRDEVCPLCAKSEITRCSKKKLFDHLVGALLKKRFAPESGHQPTPHLRRVYTEINRQEAETKAVPGL